MSTESNVLADKVVIAFKNILSEEAKSHISEKEFDELNQIVHQALSQQLTKTADIIYEVSQQLRCMTEHQDIGL